jgi:hypothetical protein
VAKLRLLCAHTKKKIRKIGDKAKQKTKKKAKEDNEHRKKTNKTNKHDTYTTLATLGAPARAAVAWFTTAALREAARDAAATDMVTTDARGTARIVLVLPATSERNSVDIIFDPCESTHK